MRAGRRNLITDVAGILVGQAQDDTLKSGVSVVLGEAPFTAAVHVMGGAPGTRETDLLAPDKSVAQVDALVLSGGSAFGLDAASGVADVLRARGRGFRVGDQNIPIVPGAILFDLLNGGDKMWVENPYGALGVKALDASGPDFRLGTAGAGTGALVQNLKGGVGSASIVLDSGITVGALVAVNALGRVTIGDGPHFWAGLYEMEEEFGGLGTASEFDPSQPPPVKGRDGEATTIAVVATDAALTKAEVQRMSIAAHDGMARAIWPSHTPMDGDLVFGAATARGPIASPQDMLSIGHAGALCLSRAIARGVYMARPARGDVLPCWQSRFRQ